MSTTVDLNELYRERAKCLADARATVTKADKENRELSTQEEHQYEELVTKSEELRKSIIEVEANREQERRNVPSGSNDTSWHPYSASSHQEGEIRTLTPSQKLSDLYQSKQPLSIGKLIRGMAIGNWKGAEAEQRAMSEGTLSAGGYTVPAPMAAQVIDRARNQSKVFQAGATTVVMNSQTLSYGKVLTDPTTAWKLENNAITASDMTFGQVKLDAKTLVALCKLSVEVFEDAQNIDQIVSNALSAAIALELDRAALRGTGTAPEPRGIRNQVGITTIDMGVNGLALTDYTKFSSAVQKLQEANANDTSLAAVYAPRTAGTIDGLKDTTNQPLQPPASFQGLRKFVTNQIPINLTHGTGTTCSEAYIGDFSQLLIGMRTNLTIEVSRQAADATNSAFSNLQVWIRAYLRADVQLAQASHFVLIDGIL